MDYTAGNLHKLKESDFDSPKEIAEKCIELQKKLLIGFKGYENVNKKKLQEAFEPKQVAISLAGEPTLYPKLAELIEEFHKRGMTTFLVTNGTSPDAIKNLAKKGKLPTQLYISVSAPTKELCLKIDRPLIKGGWEKLHESLGLMKNLSTRTVVRLTLIRSMMVMPEKYAEMIEKAMPMFVECKGYVHVGFSQRRLPKSEMPEHKEILGFAKKIAGLTGYKIANEKTESKVALLTRTDVKKGDILIKA
jgi:tRNA wybutosine-synthesizing protein 1